jgi:hypothetical protein
MVNILVHVGRLQKIWLKASKLVRCQKSQNVRREKVLEFHLECEKIIESHDQNADKDL